MSSFNGWHYYRILAATGDKQILDMTDMNCCWDEVFEGPPPGMGFGSEGYDGGATGLGNFTRFKTDLPIYHMFNGAINIDTGK